MKRIRYDRSDIGECISAAKRAYERDHNPRFVYATAYGYAVEKSAPPPGQNYYRVTADTCNFVEPLHTK